MRLLCAAACGLGCASPPARAPAPETTAQGDLFPEISADLERQLEARRAAALERGAREKAKQIDPFAVDGLEDRLEELGLARFAGCARGRGALAEARPLVPYRLLAEGHYQAREPLPRTDEGAAVARRAPVRPVVYVACEVELSARPVASGGFVAESGWLRFAALFDPELSWWNPRQRGDETTRLYGQLPFDLAHLLVREANRARPAVQGRGPTERAALDAAALELSSQLGALDRELRSFQRGLDRATDHGWDAAAVAEWTDRARYGLRELRRALPAAGGP